MSFRRTRQSRDGATWLASVLSFIGVVGAGVFSLATFTGEFLPAKIFASALFLLFIIAFGVFLRGILFPYELELVIEDGSIRWGETGKPERQQRLSILDVKRVIYDKSDNKVLVDVGSWKLLPVGDYILMQSKDQTTLIEYLCQSFPTLKIETT